jgi:hypothetical protein
MGEAMTDCCVTLHCRYGADERGTHFINSTMAGMAADPCIFIQSSVNISDIDQRSRGRWRIHSKLGNGYSTRSAVSPAPPLHTRAFFQHYLLVRSRQVGEIRSNGYACFPVLDSSGSAVVNSGAGQPVLQAFVPSILSRRARVCLGHALLRSR